MSENISIHPRVVKGRTIFPKVNTCKPRSVRRWLAAVDGMEHHLKRHPRDAACQQRLSNAKARIA